MAMEIAGEVRNPATTVLPDGVRVSPAIGQQGDMLTGSYHGRYYNAAKRGKLFHGCSAIAGNSFPIYNTTAFVFGLWNDTTDINLELVYFSAAYVSGTGVAGPFGLNFKPNTGNALGTPVSAFNDVRTGVKPGILGSNTTSRAKFSNAATNTVAAAAAADFIPLNMSHVVITAADATITPFILEQWFHGSIIVGPGTVLWPAALLA